MTKTKAKLVDAQTKNRKNSNRALARARAEKPSQVVVWYCTAEGMTGVEISEGAERTKVVGALNAAAYDLWNR